MANFWKDLKVTAGAFAGLLGVDVDVGAELRKDLQKMAAVSPESLRHIDSDAIVDVLYNPFNHSHPLPWPVVLAKIFGLFLQPEGSRGHSMYASAVRMVASRYGYETRILEVASQMSRQGLLNITGDALELTAAGEKRGAFNWGRQMQDQDDYASDPDYYVPGYGQMPRPLNDTLLDRVHRIKFGNNG